MKRIVTFVGIAVMTMFPIAVAMAQQTGQSGAQPPAQQSGQQQMLVGSDSLVGSTVRNSEGHDIGKVSRLMIDPSDGRVTSVVISTGGALGVGSSTVSIPWNSVKVGQDRGKVIVSTNQMLDSAPKAEQQKADQQGGRKDTTPTSGPGSEQQPRKQ